MQPRFVTSGTVNDEQEVILAYELNELAFKLSLYVIPKKSLTKKLLESLSNDWVAGGNFEFPKDTELITPDINADSILPDTIKTDRTGEIRHKQNEWAVQLLTNKLWESYLLELDALKKRARELNSYDKSLFEDAKSYWERVLEHKKERNITQERLDKIKEDVNAIFEQLKTFRKTESAEFEKVSNTIRDNVTTQLEEVKKRADEKANFKTLHDDIKAVQHEIRNRHFLKSDETVIRKAFDDAFHYISEQRNRYFSDKFETRISGLKEVIEKMEKGMQRDQADLDYFTKKADNPRIQSLELQLLKVRLRQIKETLASKEEKLSDIKKTLEGVLRQAHKGTKTEKEEVLTDDDSVSIDLPISSTKVTTTEMQKPKSEPTPVAEEK